uniref:Laccase n=1 Tax=Anthurium amnicola TaxID=1678845 RepID=A0A1D1Y305_9ARAE
MGLRESLLEGLLVPLFLCGFLVFPVWCETLDYVYNITETSYTRLCETKNILTVNGLYPGPTIYAHRGDTVVVHVYNLASINVTLHWHGVKQPRNPWSDGPEFITQCPIRPSANFTYNIILSDEEGTIWWHAHSDWSRATVHGAIVIYPTNGAAGYPFAKPDYEVPPIILGEYWISDVMAVLEEMLEGGGSPNISDAFTINGQPGDGYNCSAEGMYKLTVKAGKRYLLRLVNAAMNDEVFFGIANHSLTVVGADGAYTKPFTTDYVLTTPGQTLDLLLEANQSSKARYYMAAKAYSTNSLVGYDNTTSTAVLQYSGGDNSSTPISPTLPLFNSTEAVAKFSNGMKSLASEAHPVSVPLEIDHRILITASISQLRCVNDSCDGPNGSRVGASLNNISFSLPSIDVLEAYYSSISGVFTPGFPNKPPKEFNYTAEEPDSSLVWTTLGTKVKKLEYNKSVEIVFQGTSLVAALSHPMHLHGYSFYRVGVGPGNFNKTKDPENYNLVDPPLMNTFGVPRNGWAAIRFRADNPGVWFMHCHFERHTSWGMATVFIVENGNSSEAQILPPPSYMPPCN